MVELLIRNGADVDVKDQEGRTPLAVALERKNNEVVELLRTAGGRNNRGAWRCEHAFALCRSRLLPSCG